MSPIVDDPGQARPFPEATDLLARLADRYALVAVVSGRPVSYLAAHLAGSGRTRLVGLYGMEWTDAGTGDVEQSDAARAWRPAVEAAATAAEAEAPPKVVVERKGLAVTLHYRHAPGHQAWAEGFATSQATATGLAAHRGKMSVELRPAVATDKGTVVADLVHAHSLDAVCFIGDDTGDLPAFAALAHLKAAGVLRATLAVAAGSEETPADVTASADLVVDGPEGVLALLAGLAGGPGLEPLT